MKPKHLQLSLIVACGALLLFALTRGTPLERVIEPSEQHGEALNAALGAIPEDAPFVLSLDLTQPNAQALGSALFGKEHEIAGVGHLSDICGYDPTAGVKSLVVALLETPPGRTAPGVAVAASGDFPREQTARCVERVVRARGGDPKRKQTGALTLLRDRQSSSPEVALLDDGMLLVGQDDELRSMMRTLDGRAKSTLESKVHNSLRRALGEGAAALATVEFEPKWLSRLFHEEALEESPLSTIRAAALRVDVNDSVSVRLLVRCAAPERCRELATFLRELEAKVQPMLTKGPAAKALASGTLVARGPELHGRFRFDSAEFARLLDDLSSAEKPRNAGPDNQQARPTSVPDEIIEAKPNP